jgi:hypothetical protein
VTSCRSRTVRSPAIKEATIAAVWRRPWRISRVIAREMGPFKPEVLEAFSDARLIHVTSHGTRTCFQTIGLTTTPRVANRRPWFNHLKTFAVGLWSAFHKLNVLGYEWCRIFSEILRGICTTDSLYDHSFSHVCNISLYLTKRSRSLVYKTTCRCCLWKYPQLTVRIT